ncbi:MAG: nicotinate-nicotinamide nucleotide adenylyltransferase [Myxococcales bacterium]
MEIALFGGSFDPPHVGHLLAAAYVLATEPVGELWLVPVNEHPFGKRLAAPFEHRATLCEAMIEDAGLRRARVSRIEAEIGGEVRTVDLLEYLRRTQPDHSFALVLGSDLAAERPQWKRFDRILELARIIELRRGGFEGGSGAVLPEVSSTQVRELLASGGDASRLVSREVLRRIAAAGTYRGVER